MLRKLGDVVREVVKKVELPQREVKQIIAAYHAAILDFMANGDDVLCGDLGKFEVVVRKALMVRNPRTGETFLQPATRRQRFKFYPEVKKAVKANRRGLDDQAGLREVS